MNAVLSCGKSKRETAKRKVMKVEEKTTVGDSQDYKSLIACRGRMRVVPMRVDIACPGVFVQRCKGE